MRCWPKSPRGSGAVVPLDEKPSIKHYNPKSPIVLTCASVLVTLIVVMPLFGYFSYTVLYDHEETTFRTLFDSLADDIFQEIDKSMTRMQEGAALFSSYIGQQNPGSADWPNVTIPHYGIMNDHIEKLSASRFAMVPIVYPEDAAGFEAHSKLVFAETPDVPVTAGYNSFGYGIFKFQNGVRVHDTTGETTFSDKNLMTPVLYSAFPKETSSFLFNLHSTEARAIVQDGIIDCVNAGCGSCLALSEIEQTISQVNYKPNTIFYHPIRPFNNQSALVGFLTVGFKWDILLSGSLSETVQDVQIVVTSPQRQYTFEMRGGEPRILGEGDRHNKKFDYMEERFEIPFWGAAPISVPYAIKIYPTQQFFDEYHSDLPIRWTAIGLGVIVVITCLFIAYDWLVKEDSLAREQMLHDKRLFVRLVSHEIRTPLNTVKMGLRLQEEALKAQRSCKICKEMQELLTDIQSSTEVALTVLNDLLQYDKIEMGRLTIEVGEVCFWKLIKDVVHSFFLDAANKNVKLQLESVHESLTIPESQRIVLSRLYVLGDNIRLAQTIRNLVSNALKFSPPSSTVTVRAQWVEHGLPQAKLLEPMKKSRRWERMGSILLSVQDSGPGISEENQKKLFVQGQQFNANELQGGQGSGLGLFISKGIVELHNGHIWAVSNDNGPERGTTFFLEIPVAFSGSLTIDCLINSPTVNSASPSASDSVCSTFEEKRVDSKRQKKRKILVCEDSVSNRKLVCRLLAREGYDFGTAENGQQCVDIMNSPEGASYTCILMDNHMPVMTGAAATATLRRTNFTLPIFGLTGSVMKEDVQFFMDSGADFIFEKPLDIDLFFSKLNEMLETVKENIISSAELTSSI